MGFTLITVTGRFMRPDGVTPAEGRVEFKLRTALRNTESDEIVEPQRISEVLDEDGAITVDLVATDDTDTRPTGGVWEVTERISGSRPRAYQIVLAHTLPGGTLDLADAAPVSDVQLYDYALVTHTHTAAAVTFAPTGPIAATNVQDAIVEAATEATHPNLASHDALGLATQDELDSEAADRAAADALLIPLDQKGAADGVATLGPDSKIPTAQLPPLAINDFLGTVASQAAMLALVGQRGDWAVRTDTDPDEAWTIVGDDPTQLASWQRFGTFGGVLSVNGQTGAVVLPVDGPAGTASLRTLGNGATQAAAGADLAAEAETRADADATKVDKATFDANSILKADADDTPSALVVPASTVVARKAAGGIVAATMADLRAMLATVDDTAPAQRVTGLNGLSPRSLVGRKTTSGPPTAGTWAVDDEVLDSDGVRWRCTVAGTPGTWSIFGPLMREIGYVELTTDESFAFATLGAADTDVAGFTATVTVATRPIEIVFDSLINNDGASASTTVKVKEGATEILRVAKEGGITANQLCARPKRRRLGGPSQPSPGPHTYKVTCAVSAGTGHIRGDVNPASVQIFEL